MPDTYHMAGIRRGPPPQLLRDPGQPPTSPTGTAKPTAPAALIGREQHAGEQEQDRCQRDHQRDQDVGGWPEAAAVVPERHLLGWSLPLGAGSGFVPGPLNTLSGLGSQKSGMDRLLPSEVEMMANRHEMLRGRNRSAAITMAAPGITPHKAEAGAGSGGARIPAPASKRGGCSAAAWVATCPRRSRYPSSGGIRTGAFFADLGDLDGTEARDRGPRSRQAGQRPAQDPAGDCCVGCASVAAARLAA
jgi:hypothetical protein